LADAAGINLKLKKWRQGDVILGLDLPFLHVFDAHSPITDLSRQEVADEPPKAEDVDFRSVGATVAGFVVITQTCDIVRGCEKRQYIELVPLVQVDEDTYNLIKADRVPRFAFLRPLEPEKLVADLDRVMTVEKSLLARIPDHARLLGCETDEEQNQFVRALVRKRSRFAFPEPFVKAMRAIQDRVQEKHTGMILLQN
jgi:hypothetical protein